MLLLQGLIFLVAFIVRNMKTEQDGTLIPAPAPAPAHDNTVNKYGQVRHNQWETLRISCTCQRHTNKKKKDCEIKKNTYKIKSIAEIRMVWLERYVNSSRNADVSRLPTPLCCQPVGLTTPPSTCLL